MFKRLFVFGFLFSVSVLIIPFIIPTYRNFWSIRRIKDSQIGQQERVSSIFRCNGAFENESLISQWNSLFAKMAEDAKIHPEQYKSVEFFFVREDNSGERMLFFIPENVSDRDLDAVIRYLTAKINNYIVTHSAKKVYVKSGFANIYKKLDSHFRQNYEREDARITVADISAVYSGVDKFEILPYQDKAIPEVVSKKARQGSGVKEILSCYRSTNIVVNIGKTKIKFGIARIEENGTYRLSSVFDINTWEQGEDRRQYNLIEGKVISGINRLLKQSGLSTEDIDGIGLSGAVIVKNGAPLPLRTGFSTFFSDESLKELTFICDAVSRAFGNLPVIMGNDGDMEALSIAKIHQYKNTLVLKFGTTLAAGYIDEDGNIFQGVNEFNRLVIDLSKDAFLQDSTKVRGTAGRYISWVGIENIARVLGLYEKYGFSPEDKVPKILRAWLDNGTEEQKQDASKVFAEVGKYVGVMADEASRYVKVDNVVISGGLVAGKAGEIIIQSANDYLRKIISGTTISVSLSSEDIEVLRYGGLIGAGYLINGRINTSDDGGK